MKYLNKKIFVIFCLLFFVVATDIVSADNSSNTWDSGNLDGSATNLVSGPVFIDSAHQAYSAYAYMDVNGAGAGDTTQAQANICFMGNAGTQCFVYGYSNNGDPLSVMTPWTTLGANTYDDFDSVGVFYLTYNGVGPCCGGVGFTSVGVGVKGRVVSANIQTPSVNGLNTSFSADWETDWSVEPGYPQINVSGPASGCNYANGTVPSSGTLTCNITDPSIPVTITLTAMGPAENGGIMTVKKTAQTIPSDGNPGGFAISGGCYNYPSAPQSDAGLTSQASGATSYSLFRRINGGSWTLVKNAGAGSLSALNYTESATNGAYYEWKAIAYNANGETESNFIDYTINSSECSGSVSAPVYGCTDPTATNYNPGATMSDGSCTYGGGPTACTDNASGNFTINIPNSVSPGEVVPFAISINNNGTTKWYEGAAYRLLQQSALTISPTYGHIPYVMDTGDGNNWGFTLTAPSTAGTYTLSMRMVHIGGWYHRLSDNSICGTTPSADTPFGVTISKSFTVVANSAPVPTGATISPTPVVASTTSGSIHTIRLTATDANGASDITHQLAVVNYTSGPYRGYIGWNKTGDFSWPVSWGGSVEPGSLVTCDDGVSKAAKHPNSAWNQGVVTITGCSTSVSGNTRTTDIRVKYNSTFTTPTTGNIISQFVADTARATGGWTPFGTFNLATIPVVTFNAAEASISSGQSTTLTWTVSGTVDSCVASGDWSGSKSISGGSEPTGSLTTSKTYNLICTGPMGSTSSSVTVTVAAACTNDCAQYVSHTINGVTRTDTTPFTIYSGQTYTASVLMRNSGTLAWPGGSSKYKIVPVAGANPNLTNVTVNTSGSGVSPSTNASLVISNGSLVAPAVGTYTFKWQMNTSTNVPIGDISPGVTINVVPPPPTPPTGLSSSCSAVAGVQRVTLSWADQVWESSYTVQISGMSAVTLGANTTSYGPITVTDNVPYTWTVFATNSTGVSAVANGSFKCPDTFVLTIAANPSPTGHVSSSVGGISCGTISGVSYSQCASSPITNGDSVTLTATPASSYWQFSTWGGDCSSFGSLPTCTLTVDSNKSVTATFVKRVFNYTEF